MRKPAPHLIAALALAGLISGGCSLGSVEKKYEDVTGRSEKATHVELNSARRKRLNALPGLTGDDADRIIANRPYEKKHDLVRKGVLSESQFEKIKDDVYVEHGKE